MNSPLNLKATRYVLAIVVFFVALPLSLSLAQTPFPDDWPSWTVVSRDENSTTREIAKPSSDTTGLAAVQRVVDVGSGLNYLDADGKFQPSRDLIELMQDGSAAALYGPNKAYFSPDLSVDDAITLVTKSNRVFQTHPIGLYYVDGNRSVLIAPVQDSAVAELLPPNRVLYRGAFAANGFEADLLLTYTKQGLESDVLLIQKPKPPEAFGLNPETSILQVLHAWLNVPEPRRTFNSVESGLVDETLDFGELWFPTGKAFTWSDAESTYTNVAARLRLPGMGEDGRHLSVAKHWEQVAPNLGILSESVLWRDLVPLLASLPETARKSEDPHTDLLASVEQIAPTSTGSATGKSFSLAKAPYNPSGVVLDYVTVVGGGNYTFTNGTTYYLADGCTFASVTFQAGAFLKYGTNGYLSAYSSITCPASGKVIMTAADDNQYGQAFGSGNPKYFDRALIVYSLANTTIRNLQVRWAAVGPYYLYSANSTLSDCSLFQCGTGVKAEYSSSVTLVNDTQCAVTTPTTTASGSTITGTLTVDCGIVSVAMVNDPNRDLSGLDTNKNSQTECSFAVLNSTNIVAAFMNTHLSAYGLGGAMFPGIPSPRTTSWAVSTNGGTNFTDKGPILPISTITNGSLVVTNGAINPMHGDAGDTTMAYDSSSNVVYLLVNSSRESTNWYGFRLWASTNMGQSFNTVNMDVPGLAANGSHLVTSSDKPMIKVNPATHALYAAGSTSGNNTWMARSTNGGVTWTNFQQLETTGNQSRGADIVIAPDGTVYVFWLRMWGTTNQLRYAWLSTNNTWSTSTNIGPALNSTNSANGSGKLFRYSGAGANDYFNNNAFPRVAYANNKIYITYADLPNTNSATDHGDIFLIEAGVNWTNHWLTLSAGPRQVNNDGTQTDQWNPSIAATPSGTELFIGYYSRQNDPTTNSWIMAYGAKAFITNGLTSSTFDCFPISPTSFQPLFAGSTNSTPPGSYWLYDTVWPQMGVCLNTNAVYEGVFDGSSCSGWPSEHPMYGGTYSGYVNFCADDYTWAVADSNYLYFAWCDRSRTSGTPPYTRTDADIKLAKVRQ